ncbi:MAG: hypothetical protein M3340_07675 [Actinomycetota bacterium]|nr:hypothetical protein [Actinomycetota bacterium]
MGLLDRLLGGADSATSAAPSLARDARTMRATLTALHSERGGAELDLRALIRDLLEGEVEAPTSDVRHMIGLGVEPDEFYETELAPNWDGLDEDARADKLDRFVELAHMVEDSPDALPLDMAASLRTKLLVLGWAFDEAHGYLGRLAGT